MGRCYVEIAIVLYPWSGLKTEVKYHSTAGDIPVYSVVCMGALSDKRSYATRKNFVNWSRVLTLQKVSIPSPVLSMRSTGSFSRSGMKLHLKLSSSLHIQVLLYLQLLHAQGMYTYFNPHT